MFLNFWGLTGRFELECYADDGYLVFVSFFVIMRVGVYVLRVKLGVVNHMLVRNWGNGKSVTMFRASVMFSYRQTCGF